MPFELPIATGALETRPVEQLAVVPDPVTDTLNTGKTTSRRIRHEVAPRFIDTSRRPRLRNLILHILISGTLCRRAFRANLRFDRAAEAEHSVNNMPQRLGQRFAHRKGYQ
jgi:hypothetical protein